ncbi:MAG: VOC family protein [Bacteroidetes bacterium]|nr:VOC family protein [Bacteroidota bacterium]
MTTPFLGLRTLGFKVNDIETAKQWYTKVLGIEPYFDMPFYVGYNVAGYEFGLQQTDEALTCGNNTATYMGVSDVHATYNMLLSAGASEYETPQDVGEGIIIAAVRDPWGNVFGIIYNPHFKL